MTKILMTIGLLILAGCASQKTAKTATGGLGDTRTKEVKSLDDNTYLLTETTEDKSYGYDESNPVQVGGVSEGNGPKNERRFLNALLGPNGEEIEYFRAGSCCPFKTPNGMMENTGMLDRYKIIWSGATDTLDIFLNMYDKGDLKIPLGLTSKKG